MKSWFTVFVNDEGRLFVMPPRRRFHLTGPFGNIVLGLLDGCFSLVVFSVICGLLGLFAGAALVDAFVPEPAFGWVFSVVMAELWFWAIPEAGYKFLRFWLRRERFQPVALVKASHEEIATIHFRENLMMFLRDRVAGVISHDQAHVFLPIVDNKNNYYNHVLNGIYRDINL